MNNWQCQWQWELGHHHGQFITFCAQWSTQEDAWISTQRDNWVTMRILLTSICMSIASWHPKNVSKLRKNCAMRRMRHLDKRDFQLFKLALFNFHSFLSKALVGLWSDLRIFRQVVIVMWFFNSMKLNYFQCTVCPVSVPSFPVRIQHCFNIIHNVLSSLP